MFDFFLLNKKRDDEFVLLSLTLKKKKKMMHTDLPAPISLFHSQIWRTKIIPLLFPSSMNLHLSFSLKNFFKNIRPIIRTMADAVLNSHNIDAIESKSDEPEYDFKEYYSREKTLELRDIYIP